MVEGKRRDAWDHTAQIMAILANGLLSSKKRKEPYMASDFHPFPSEHEKRESVAPSGMFALRTLFGKGKQ